MEQLKASSQTIQPFVENVTISSSTQGTHPMAQVPDGAIGRTANAENSSQEHANKWVILTLAAVSSFMTTLDASIVNIGLPAIARSFGVPLNGAIEWIIIGYLIVIAAVLLSFGRLADMIGRKPVLLAGLAVFTLGSIFCGASPSLGLLITARIVQGLGGALIFAVNMAMITNVFPTSERGRALGINAVVVSLGVSVGPTVGGLITQSFSWRWIFLINVPIGLVVFLLSWRLLTERMHKGQGHFDPLGAVLFAIGFAALTLGISFGQQWGWSSPTLISSLVFGVVALLLAIVVEGRVQDPVVDLALLKNRVFVSANVSFLLCMLALFAVGFLLPFYLEELRGYSAAQAGLLLTPLPLTLAVIAPVSGSLADRVGSRWLAPLGLAIGCFGLFLLGQLDTQSSVWDIAWRLVVIGVGQGLFLSPNTRTLMGAAPQSEQGEASGILATGRVIGQSLSVALGGAIFATLGAAAAGSTLVSKSHTLSTAQVHALQNTFMNGFHAALFVSAAIAILGVFTSLTRGKDTKKAAS